MTKHYIYIYMPHECLLDAAKGLCVKSATYNLTRRRRVRLVHSVVSYLTVSYLCMLPYTKRVAGSVWQCPVLFHVCSDSQRHLLFNLPRSTSVHVEFLALG